MSNKKGDLFLGALMPKKFQSDRTKECSVEFAKFEKAIKADPNSDRNKKNLSRWQRERDASDADDKLAYAMEHAGEAVELINTLRLIYKELNAKTPRQMQRVRKGIDGESMIDLMKEALELFDTMYFIVPDEEE